MNIIQIYESTLKQLLTAQDKISRFSETVFLPII